MTKVLVFVVLQKMNVHVVMNANYLTIKEAGQFEPQNAKEKADAKPAAQKKTSEREEPKVEQNIHENDNHSWGQI